MRTRRARPRASGLVLVLCVVGIAVPARVAYPRGATAVSEGTLRSPGNTTYYVDAAGGDDGNPGTSARRAWKTIAKVNACDLDRGDRILFAGGRIHRGTLKLVAEDGGEAWNYVTVSSYGDGRATIDGGAGDGVVLEGCAYVTVEKLKIVGCGRKKGSNGSGIRIKNTKHVTVDEVDVSGFRTAGVNAGGDAHTRLTKVHAHDNGFAGITVYGGWGGMPRSSDLYIGHCVTNNNPGDPKNKKNHSGNGIVVGGLDGGLIEHCESYNNGWDMPRRGNGPVGIWAWNCDRVIIQCCISHDNKTQKGAWDGGGFDFDGGVTNSVMQYNLSYNNHGSGYLLCQFRGASEWKNNICRYNITVNDGVTNHFDGIHFWNGGEGFSNARIYNNLIVNERHGISSGESIPGLVFENNVIIAKKALVKGPFHNARFENNVYYAPTGAPVFQYKNTTYTTVEDWARATGQEMLDGRVVGRTCDPGVALPKNMKELPTNPAKRESMTFGRPRNGSPVVGSGTRIPDNGGRDFFGNRVARDGPANVGPCEGRP